MTLRLHVAAHDAEGEPRLFVLHREARNDGVKGTFARRINIRVARLHREKLTAILKHEAESRHDDAAAHAAEITLNQAHHISLIIRGAHVDGVALA